MFPFLLPFIQAHEIIFEDSEDEENTIVLQKTENFAEEIVPQFTNRQFKEHFRMAPNTFEDFLRKLQVSTDRVGIGHPEISLEKQAIVTLWCLANTESFRSISDRFGITKSTCWSILYRTCFRILELNKTFKVLCWPTRQRAINIMGAFQAINGFPGILTM